MGGAAPGSANSDFLPGLLAVCRRPRIRSQRDEHLRVGHAAQFGRSGRRARVARTNCARPTAKSVVMAVEAAASNKIPMSAEDTPAM